MLNSIGKGTMTASSKLNSYAKGNVVWIVDRSVHTVYFMLYECVNRRIAIVILCIYATDSIVVKEACLSRYICLARLHHLLRCICKYM